MPSQFKNQTQLKRIAALSALCIALALPLSAQAQTSIFTIPEPENESFADVGVAGLIRSTYVGSGETQERILPFVNAEYKGRFFIKPALGAGVYAIKNKQFRLSASANLEIGRDSDETPLDDLVETLEISQGIDDGILEVDTTLTANVAGRYYLPFGAIDVIGAIPIGGDINGQRVDFLFTTEVYPVKKLRITPGIRATYHSSGWLNSIYGIDTNQAEILGIDEYSLDGQISTVGAHAIAYYQLPRNLEIVGAVNYSRLLGDDLEDSPLTTSNNGITASLGIAYQF